VSAQSTWRALDEAGEARTAANRPAFFRKRWLFRHKCSFLLALYLRSGKIAGILGRKRRFQLKTLASNAPRWWAMK
jgi:hypothetical protein